MNHESRHKDQHSLQEVLNLIFEFFSQPHYSGLGPAIRERKPLFRLVFGLAGAVSTLRFGTCLLILAAYFGYPNMRRPRRVGCVFQFGMSANNERMFKRLNVLMADNSAWTPEMNDLPISLWDRFRWFSPLKAWRAAGMVQSLRSENPFVTVQLALGAAAALLFQHAYSDIRPRLIVVSNDHSPTCVAARAVGQASGIEVVYYQHAPVNALFPPLKFDLSILYDQASHDLYLTAARTRGRAPTENKVLFLSPFQENLVVQRPRRAPLNVGICMSLLPNEATFEKLIDRLAKHPNVGQIGLRLHPRSSEVLVSTLSRESIFVCPLDEPLKLFLDSFGDLVLVPNSGVAVEALHLGHPTYFVPGLDMITQDYYGFQAAGILPEFSFDRVDEPATLTAPFDDAWREAFRKFDATVTQKIIEMEAAIQNALGAMISVPRGEALAADHRVVHEPRIDLEEPTC